LAIVDSRLIYVGDPMCSWCWGFAPEIERVSDRFELPLEVVVGGLRPGPEAQPLDARLRGFLRNEWAKIQDVTGQPFCFDALDWEGWLYDTEVPAAAVALARSVGLDPVLAFMARVQHAFYAESLDVTRPEVYEDLWTHESETGVSAEEFVKRLNQPASRELAYADFRRARELGIRGFPALMFERGGDAPMRKTIAYGYQPSDQMTPAIERLLVTEQGDP